MNPILYFWIFLKASLFSTGGSGNLPSIHADLLARGWASDGEFGEALTIGQLSPGPSGLWVISLGYLTDGLRGSLLALLAILLPPMLILGVERLYRRIQHHPAVEGFVRGLGLAVVGVFVVAMFGILQSAGISPRTMTIAAGAVGLALTRRVPVIGIVALAGLSSVLWR
ncbi:MAG: chromate transporter [Capsulimonas sp.]|uniref:chromate transporter n=1 Tax=Capsulimonas sp. TaxID=2494211 RepID=UPI003262ECF7